MESNKSGERGFGGSPVAVDVSGLTKTFGSVQAVRDITFAVAPSSTLTLLGPSGCGKTTTLRCLAGLEPASAGTIRIGGQTFFDSARGIFVEAEHRNIGMVFQSYAIWPHMTVGQNVSLPLKIAKVERSRAATMAAEILALVGLSELTDRSASALSGGQQQRVALARALVHRPSVVLFDEPLSNLDANLRERMRTELQLLQRRLGFTAIYVTHDQQEAMALSDQILIMNKGRIEQISSPEEIFNKPATHFVATFLGYANSLRGRVERVEGGLVFVVHSAGAVIAARWEHVSVPAPGREVLVTFRPDAVRVEADEKAKGNVLTGQVESSAFLGTHIDYVLQTSGGEIRAAVPAGPRAALGSALRFSVPETSCHAYPAEPET